MENKEKNEENKKLIKIINSFFISYFNWLLVVWVLLIIVSGYYFIILPGYNKTSEEIGATVSSQSVLYDNRQQYLTQLLKINDDFKNISATQLKRIEALLPSEAGGEELLLQLESIAANNGVLLTSLKFEKLDEKREVSVLKINLSLSGVDYVSVKNLLSAIEKNLRLINVTSLNFTASGGISSLEMEAYYLNK